MISRILTTSFYLLFFLTPLVWTPFNFELFEYNKMMLVYLLTTIITFAWIIKMINHKSLIISRTPLDIPILLFLGANILSTIFSIDQHTSIFGYYSRLNGGLLSIISYTLLYFALVSNFNKEEALKFLKAAVFGGLIVALYAIPEHFGVSPSCVILTQDFSANCWVQDVQARVFATLGQPNWLAAYMAMIIFPAFYFLLSAKTKFQLITYCFSLIVFYLAFTFTYSRGATLGLFAGLIIFFGVIFWQIMRLHLGGGKLIQQYKPLLIILGVFLSINLFFGSALTGNLKLINKFAAPARPTLSVNNPAPSGTQLENGGTESGAIRLIVWQGALNIWKAYPIFGSGVETFAYSYYNFRPASHNSVSEWDFLYNKAHNEYLNYLANTGLIGFLAYMSVILTFIIFCIKYYVLSIMGNRKSETINTYYLILIPSLFASYISYLIQNFFGFSVVSVALFFYLFPAIAFLTTDSVHPVSKLFTFKFSFLTFIYRRPLYTNLVKTFLIIIFLMIIITLIRNYWADTYFSVGNNASDAGNPGKAYNQLTNAISLNPGEPYYRSELAFAAAEATVALSEDDPTTSAKLKNQAVKETEQVLKTNPKNVSFYRSAIRTYYLLSTLDPIFTDKTLQIMDQTIALAPTDAKLVYNKAIILGQIGKNQEAIQNLQKAITLKPNYRDAYYSLGLYLFDEKQKDEAIKQMQKVLELVPNDPDAVKKIKEWSK